MSEGSDEQEDQISSEEDYDPFRGLLEYQAITVLFSEGPPKVNLGGVPPTTALTVLEVVCASLRECVLLPVIEYDGDVIYDPYFYEEELEEEEEGD